MKTNFKNTYGQKLNTIRKTTDAKKTVLQASTTRHKKKSRENTNAARPTEKRRMLTKTTMASLDGA